MQQPRSQVWITGLLLLTLLAGLGAGILLDREVLGAQSQAGPGVDSPQSATDLNYNLITQALGIVDQNYVDRSAIQTQPLTYGAVSGLVDALGDTGHSRFMTPDEVRQQQTLSTGQFEGIGAEVQMKDGGVTIVAPYDGSPAQRAGLLPGDVIVQVEGKSVAGETLSEVVSKVLGPAGTTVHLTILTPSTGNTRDVTIVRARITIHDVTWHQLPGTTLAHVRISQFSNGVDRDLDQDLATIQQQHLTGIILDLRNDPGGLLDESVATASNFLSSGNVLLEKNAKGKVTPVPVEKEGTPVTLPMVVLINEGSASASEIVAGALQDANRAKLVGETTFGTGTVLSTFPLEDGSALLLATEEWLTPAGRVIWHHGITPDVVVTQTLSTLPVLPEAEESLTPQQLQNSGDAQLLRGISILASPPAP
jgi:carboxyl-terminal processing protease